MPPRDRPAARRRDALSAAVIVRAAIEILDADGADALTFRTLAARLHTGAGALYHHVAHKEELLAAAATDLVTPITEAAGQDLRDLMLRVFDLIDAHPWLGGQLARSPWQPAVLSVLAAVGERLGPITSAERRFHAATALVNYLLGAAGQQAAIAHVPDGADRQDFLESIAAHWAGRTDLGTRPFVRELAQQLADHDDRRQFAAGIELILAGIEATAGAPD